MATARLRERYGDVDRFQKLVRKSFHSSGGGVEFFPLVVVVPGEISPSRLIIQSSSALVHIVHGREGRQERRCYMWTVWRRVRVKRILGPGYSVKFGTSDLTRKVENILRYFRHLAPSLAARGIAYSCNIGSTFYPNPVDDICLLVNGMEQ